MESLWEQRPGFLSGEGGLRPGFHITYKTVTSGPTCLNDNQGIQCL